MSKLNVTTFGENIRSLREKSGLPIRKIAAQLDIDPSLLGKFERNERVPTKDVISRIARVYKQEEGFLMKQLISDQFAAKIIEEESDIEILKFTEAKVLYHKNLIKK